MIGRHDPYAVTKEAEARWLDHMEAALDDIHEIDSKSHLFNFFKSKLFLAHDVSKLMYVSLHHLCVFCRLKLFASSQSRTQALFLSLTLKGERRAEGAGV